MKTTTLWLLALVMAGCAHPSLKSAEVHALVDQGALLLDVRSPAEFAEGHLAGAINIPVQELESRLAELPADKTREVLVYCRSGMRSARARTMLLAAGFVKVDDLGAMANWK